MVAQLPAQGALVPSGVSGRHLADPPHLTLAAYQIASALVGLMMPHETRASHCMRLAADLEVLAC